MSTNPDSPEPADGPLEPGLRAARRRAGYTQERLAELINVSLSTYRKWERGGRPADPRKAQVLATATRTPIHVIWPPDSDPTVASALDAVRLQQDIEDAKATDRERHQDAADGLIQPIDVAWPPTDAKGPPVDPPAAPASSSYGLHRQIEATNRDLTKGTPGVRRPDRRRVVIPAAASIAVIAAAGTAIATTSGEESPVRQEAPAVQAGPTAAERERTARERTLAEAKGRGDYDAAITTASQLNDTAAIAELRGAAGDLLARRARQAAERGDLPLATSRLNRAEDRYGNSPTITAVRRRIDRIQDARKKRAAQRKRDAERRAAARARAAAAARQRAPSQGPPSNSPSTPSTPATPAPSPSPSPTPSPKPAPSTGGGSGGGSGGSSSKPVDPGIF